MRDLPDRVMERFGKIADAVEKEHNGKAKPLVGDIRRAERAIMPRPTPS